MQRARISCQQQVPRAQLDYLNDYVHTVNSFFTSTHCSLSEADYEHLTRLVGGVPRDQDSVARSVLLRSRVDTQVSTQIWACSDSLLTLKTKPGDMRESTDHRQDSPEL